jgi:hypothetical protein
VLLPTVGRTWRLRFVGGEHLEAWRASGEPAVLVFWHDRLPGLAYLVYRLNRHGARIALLTSPSRDGELVARLGAGWDFDIVRGSSSRGGQGAVRALVRRVREARSSPIVVPDGPRGPRHRFKPGALLLAQLAEIPILPLSYAAASAWTLRSWDRMQIPKPFTRMTIAVGTPRHVARRLPPEAEAAERERQEQLLLELGELARANL